MKSKNTVQSVKLIAGFKADEYKEDDSNFKDHMQVPEDECTFYRTGKNFELQHWYMCYTCKMDGNSGCCSVCIRKCHAGHHVAYAKKSSFFCDCAVDSGKCKIYNSDKRPSGIPKPREQQREFAFGRPPGMGAANPFGMPPPMPASGENAFSSVGLSAADRASSIFSAL